MDTNALAERDTIVFVSLARRLGGSTRSLSTVLGPLKPAVSRVVASPSDGKYLDYVRKISSTCICRCGTRAGHETADRSDLPVHCVSLGGAGVIAPVSLRFTPTGLKK